MAFAAVLRVQRKLVESDRPIDVRVGLIAGAIDREVGVEHCQANTAGYVELTGERKQSVYGPDGLDTAVGVLETGVHDRAGAGGSSQASCQVADRVGRDSGDGFGHLGGEVPDVGAQLVEPVAPIGGEVFVVQVFVDQHSDHG